MLTSYSLYVKGCEGIGEDLSLIKHPCCHPISGGGEVPGGGVVELKGQRDVSNVVW